MPARRYEHPSVVNAQGSDDELKKESSGFADTGD